MADNEGSHFTDYLFTFLAGAAAGFIVGILFAPSSGKETKKEKLKNRPKKARNWLSRVIPRWLKKQKKERK